MNIMDEDKEDSGFGQSVPDCILLHLFGFLNDAKDLCSVGLVCESWYRVSCDNYLWRKLFCNKWKVRANLVPGKSSWKDEYIRLCYRTPIIETQELASHADEVLHVSFSHDGSQFASCSKDCHVKVWNSKHPVTLRCELNMKKYEWKYTQFSQFNQSDTLLLVSGVLTRTNIISRTDGEIAIFSFTDDEFVLQSRIRNQPYDIFGAWYSDSYLLSGSIKMLPNVDKITMLWLNSAFQEINCENKSVLQKLYRFHNINASSIRSIMVANCSDAGLHTEFDAKKKRHIECVGTEIDNRSFGSILLESDDESDDDVDVKTLADRDKYLIFTTGSKAYTPHEIGFKKVEPVQFNRKISLNLADRLAERRDFDFSLARREPLLLDVDIETMVDKIDCRIDLNGHIIGMALSPDHKYLYVNCRPWPKDARVSPFNPPPIAQEIDIHVIDMSTLKEVGTLLRSHKAFTPNDECFFIFLDVSNHYVASGAEDKHGYLWDRHYSTLISKLEHNDVVNSVAFNPSDEEMLVTVSDDFTIKVWRSKSSLEVLKHSKFLNSGFSTN